MLKRKFTFIILLFVAFLVSGQAAFGQKREKQKSVKKQKKEFMELQKERSEADTKKMEAIKEKHLKIQTKETRKRMKQNRKKMKRLKNNKHKDNFFQRLFRKKPKR